MFDKLDRSIARTRKEIDDIVETFILLCLQTICPICNLPVKTLKRLIFQDLCCNEHELITKEEAVMTCDRGHSWKKPLKITLKLKIGEDND